MSANLNTDTRLRLTISDVMGFWSDALGIYVPDPNHKSTKTYWFRVPASWLDGDKLLPQRWMEIGTFMYGEDWPRPREAVNTSSRSSRCVVTDDSWRDESISTSRALAGSCAGGGLQG